MANYNLYKNIDPGSLRSAASSVKQKLTTNQSKLNSYNASLNDAMWKANSKATLKTAFGKIDSEVYKDLFTNLDKLSQIAGYIEKYNTARNRAESYKSYLDSATEDTPQSSIDSWNSSLSQEERTMEDCEKSINDLL